MTALVVAGRELRGAFSLPIAYVVVAAFLVLSGSYLFVLHPFFVVGRATLRPLFEFAPFLFTLFAPAITMRGLAEERRAGTLELLLTWPVSDGALVLGKFLGAWGLLALAVGLTLPAALSVAALGDLDWGPVWGGYVGLLLLGGAYLALGLLASALTANQIVAFIFGFLACFVGFSVGRLAEVAPDGLGAILHGLSFERRFSRVARGVLDSRDLVFFGTVIWLSLAVTAERLRARRWR
ncbi:MAG: ABC transporter permease subunit [Myxococcales bacterium]|nr:ABC transporter permease subunit [Myxococcales bacterium]MCB9522732.1 ABC transporter permease subunit [Myxococcales bacterium]